MKIKKLALLGLAATMVVSTPVLAASTLVDSKGSVDMTDDRTTVGVDVTQDKHTEYYDEITEDKEENTCSVYATQASTFSVVIPKTIILDGAKDAKNAGTYVVTVKGNIAGTEAVTVQPETSFQMTQAGKEAIDATVTQDNVFFKVAEAASEDAAKTVYGVDNLNGASQSGEVEVTNLSAGSWTGSFNFNISLNSTSASTATSN